MKWNWLYSSFINYIFGMFVYYKINGIHYDVETTVIPLLSFNVLIFIS